MTADEFRRSVKSAKPAEKAQLRRMIEHVCGGDAVTCAVCERTDRPRALRCPACGRLICLDCVTVDEAIVGVCRCCFDSQTNVGV